MMMMMMVLLGAHLTWGERGCLCQLVPFTMFFLLFVARCGCSNVSLNLSVALERLVMACDPRYGRGTSSSNGMPKSRSPRTTTPPVLSSARRRPSQALVSHISFGPGSDVFCPRMAEKSHLPATTCLAEHPERERRFCEV
uniref:Putative secreted protein n=1 Tax=Anopheles marajoara TaxID=58244 RepID=A0A2M4C6S2_9DIPT